MTEDELHLTAVTIKVVMRGDLSEGEVQKKVDYYCDSHLEGRDTAAILYVKTEHAHIKFSEAADE